MTDFSPLSTAVSLHGPHHTLPSSPAFDADAARRTAEKLEVTFLAEMLKSAGFGAQENSFSSSAGEDQFASFHRQAIAEKWAASGGIGLAEHILRQMTDMQDDS